MEDYIPANSLERSNIIHWQVEFIRQNPSATPEEIKEATQKAIYTGKVPTNRTR